MHSGGTEWKELLFLQWGWSSRWRLFEAVSIAPKLVFFKIDLKYMYRKLNPQFPWAMSWRKKDIKCSSNILELLKSGITKISSQVFLSNSRVFPFRTHWFQVFDHWITCFCFPLKYEPRKVQNRIIWPIIPPKNGKK